MMKLRRIIRSPRAIASAVAVLAVIGSPALSAPSASAAASSIHVCHDPNWGGSFYCAGNDSNHGETWYQLPNRAWQLFVVGTDWAVWTRWSGPNGLSSWTSLGGRVDRHSPSVGIYIAAQWRFTLDVTGTDGGLWYDTRYSDGTWSGWKDLPP